MNANTTKRRNLESGKQIKQQTVIIFKILFRGPAPDSIEAPNFSFVCFLSSTFNPSTHLNWLPAYFRHPFLTPRLKLQTAIVILAPRLKFQTSSLKIAFLINPDCDD
jgi:hypothetical protein